MNLRKVVPTVLFYGGLTAVAVGLSLVIGWSTAGCVCVALGGGMVCDALL
jgi:hypothetical protein